MRQQCDTLGLGNLGKSVSISKDRFPFSPLISCNAFDRDMIPSSSLFYRQREGISEKEIRAKNVSKKCANIRKGK